jgi:hypothetical protein
MISRKTSRSLPVATGDEIHVVFEVHIAEDAEARHLALEQARVFQEVAAWLAAQKSSEIRQNRVA